MKMSMNMESLEQAIKDFNDWSNAARIYIDTNDGYFETSVYRNGLQMATEMSPSRYVAVYSKGEFDGNMQIGDKRKEYIIKYTQLILDGWEPLQADYKDIELSG